MATPYRLLYECTNEKMPWSRETFLRMHAGDDWYSITPLDLIDDPFLSLSYTQGERPTFSRVCYCGHRERIRVVVEPNTGRRKPWIGPGYDRVL